MNDQTKLLEQLRIDRGRPEPAPSRARGLWWLVASVLIGGAVFALLWWRQFPSAIPVRVAVAESIGGGAATAAQSVLDASGYVVPRRQATVSSKVTGKVVELRFEEGQAIAAGAVLARLDSSNAKAELALSEAQVEAARSSLAELKVQLTEAERRLRRSEELVARQLVSQAETDDLRSAVDSLQARITSAEQNVTVSERRLDVARQALDDTTVRAPFAGIITEKNAQVGEMISPLATGGAGTRTGIGTLVDMDSLEIEVDVNENFINRVQADQRVSAKLNAYPDWEIPAHVIAVIPTADRSKATVTVRIAFDERDPRILPEMGVRVAFQQQAAAAQQAAGETPSGVRIPSAAVQDGAVYVVNGDVVERRAVTVRSISADQAVVSAGLRSGERVALSEQPLADHDAIRILQ